MATDSHVRRVRRERGERWLPKARSRRHQNDMSNQQRPETETRGSHSSPPSCSADRVIIGESLQAGWPISASVYHPDGKGDFGMPPMRWVKRLDSTFALECYVFGQSKWVEVPLWNSQPNEKLSDRASNTNNERTET